MSLSRQSGHPLTPKMREALTDATHHVEGLRRTFDDKPGRPSWPASPATLHALVRHGLLETRELRNRKGYRIQAWFITPEGRRALEPVLVVKRDVPLYLARGGGPKYRTLPGGRQEVIKEEGHDPSDIGYTTSQCWAADDLETMDPALLHPAWQENAERHRKRARADVHAARLSGLTHPEEREAELRRIAAQRGQDVASEVKRVELTRKAHERAVQALERKVRADDRAA